MKRLYFSFPFYYLIEIKEKQPVLKPEVPKELPKPVPKPVIRPVPRPAPVEKKDNIFWWILASLGLLSLLGG